MPHVCLLYSWEDGQSWQKYFTKLINKSKVTHVSLSVKENDEDLEKALADCQVVVILLTEKLVEYFLVRGRPVCNLLNEHQSVAVISWPSLEEDLSKLKLAFSNSSRWKELLSDGSIEQCQRVVAELAGLVDEQEKSKKKVRRKRNVLEIIPDRVHKSNEKIAIIFHEAQTGTVQIKLQGGNYVDCRRKNDYTYTFKAPLHDFGVTKLSVYVDAISVHQCPFTYQTPSLEAFRSISFLAQTLGLNKDNMEELDRKLVDIYESSVPTDLSLHQATNVHLMSNKVGRSDFGIPTLLHFAAQYGLTELCCAVLDTPGSLAAFHIENKDGLDPAQIADKEGFQELASFIRMFVETAAMIEVSDEIYLTMTGEHLYNNRQEVVEDQEDKERQAKLHTSKSKKKLPPIPKKQPKSRMPKSVSEPIIEEENEEEKHERKRKQLPPPPGGLSRSTSDQTIHVSEEESTRRKKSSPPPVHKKPLKGSRSPTPERKIVESSLSSAEFMGMSGKGLNIPKSPGSLGSSSLDELIEIQKGVSEKEFSIEEAERLYSAWRERNRSLKMSIKDRHKGLEEMRSTYSEAIIQAKSKAQAERRSLFDRLKTTFGGRKSSRSEITQPNIKHTTYERVTDWANNRASTLSSSSSASGSSRDSRMSISSQDSLYHSTDSESEGDVQRRGEKSTTDEREQIYRGRMFNKHLDVNRSKIYSMEKRLSYKDHYLQQSISVDQEGPPPIPPRLTKPK
ncbi:phosphoinositide 3-kinase adapter protein 1-like isoform X3 [Ostrea edulis]|uniref:phosphoinositide 3-kinase adapter protein 1-like isoform X3 n=1 Tax=Ostrea edulis TaxID=37623 RepID=UPI0024AF8520|nr:phosphoinositide 3-kinase adapter protein 1-like isoform X3 [Ostrea edulis]XP_056019619.1 phosphoinositide 3-kinase adapter protein 1-like isoform X3 [Ostrea edulis]